MRSTLIWGANTGVGKTLVSAGLLRAAARSTLAFYLKPVQTGAPADSDGRHVALLAGDLPHELGPHAAVTGLQSTTAGSATSRALTLFAWKEPVSPHIAAAKEGRAVSDAVLLADTRAALASFESAGGSVALIETAGGVASPAPSGSLQCDAWRPLATDATSLLVGDGRLGGISQTICAAESLTARGHEVGAVVILSDADATERFGNAAALRAHPASRRARGRVRAAVGTQQAAQLMQ